MFAWLPLRNSLSTGRIALRSCLELNWCLWRPRLLSRYPSHEGAVWYFATGVWATGFLSERCVDTALLSPCVWLGGIRCSSPADRLACPCLVARWVLRFSLDLDWRYVDQKLVASIVESKGCMVCTGGLCWVFACSWDFWYGTGGRNILKINVFGQSGRWGLNLWLFVREVGASLSYYTCAVGVGLGFTIFGPRGWFAYGLVGFVALCVVGGRLSLVHLMKGVLLRCDAAFWNARVLMWWYVVRCGVGGA